jgi:putative thiamine transport system substrate-binding protein
MKRKIKMRFLSYAVFGRIVCLLTLAYMSLCAQASKEEWDQILTDAKGQTVYFNAWGGSTAINEYIRWAADEIELRYGVKVKHVKVTDTGEVVSRILAEKTAGRYQNGTVDLVWINGENFRSMKANDLLTKAYTQKLPNYTYVDTDNKPSTLYDFTVAVDNLEAPWGMAQLVFMYDEQHIKQAPNSMLELLAVAKKHPGRVTYPAPSNFYGTTFVKQALLELTEDKEALYKPLAEADFAKVTAPLWEFLDALHPYMWRKGKSFTSGAPEMKQLLNDGEIFISLSFNPNDANNAIANDELPDSVRTYIHRDGTLGNTHFVGIPFNSSMKSGAMVVANFLMSAQAQAKKADPLIWGDPTVLAVDRLPKSEQQLFAQIPLGETTLTAQALGAVLLEPHVSWVDALERAWLARYSK